MIDKIIGTPTNKWADGYTTITGWQYGYLLGKNEGKIKLTRFLLENIDEMREQLMLNYNGYDIFSAGITPYSYLNQFTLTGKYTTQYNQEGLGIRTYKSDIFNNWLNAEQINAINETSAIAVLNDKITIDQIILQKKVFELLNRIAVSRDHIVTGKHRQLS